MTNEQTGTLVLQDATENYFLVQVETLERGRVPDAHKAEVERRIAEQGDVQGYVVPVFVAGIAVGAAATSLALLADQVGTSLSLNSIQQQMPR
jgi:hypothetical protein